jgi:hypothetical protein
MDSTEGQYYIMKMSDNLYYGYRDKRGILRTYSLDGKRMECSHDTGDRDDYLAIFE